MGEQEDEVPTVKHEEAAMRLLLSLINARLDKYCATGAGGGAVASVHDLLRALVDRLRVGTTKNATNALKVLQYETVVLLQKQQKLETRLRAGC